MSNLVMLLLVAGIPVFFVVIVMVLNRRCPRCKKFEAFIRAGKKQEKCRYCDYTRHGMPPTQHYGP